jgi:hypothetical protein
LLLAVSSAEAASLLWGDFQLDKIQRFDVGSIGVQTIVGDATNPKRPRSVAVDASQGHLYWTEYGPLGSSQGRILRSDLDGSGLVTVVPSTGVPSTPSGLALDLAHGKMYWTDALGTNPVRRANLDGSDIEAIADGASAMDIALDVAGGKMYWTNWLDGTVRRANLDGTEPQILIGPDLDALPIGIALDLTNGHMYWAESGNNVIRRANLDGTGAVNVLAVVTPMGVALDVAGNRLYWTQQSPGPTNIFSAQLNGTGVQLHVANLGTVIDLTVATDLPPQTIIDSGPAPVTNQTDAVFTFHSTEADSLFECRLDGGPFTSCTSPVAFTVGVGAHLFEVRAIDPEGIGDPTSASRAWTVDLTPPQTTISSGPTGTIAQPTATFAWTGSDDITATPGLTYAFRLAPLQAAFSAFGGATSQTFAGLADGSYTLHVKARDAAGNEDATAATRSFTVKLPPGIRVVSPNGGETWNVGVLQTISWTFSGSVGANVKINLFKNGVFLRTIVASTPIGTGGAGSFLWNVPVDLKSGADYKVKVISLANSTYQDLSNANFTIVGLPAAITVQSPNGGESWGAGTSQTIRWSYIGDPGATVTIALLKGGAVNRTIVSGAPIGSAGNGSFTWRVPAALVPGTDYQIRLVSVDGQQDTSNGFFTITGTGITVVSPNGGEVTTAGAKLTILWSYTGSPGATVRISLFKNGVFNRTITGTTSIGAGGTGSFEWTIPATQTPGTDYRVKVVSNANSTYQDTSNGNFTIGPP